MSKEEGRKETLEHVLNEFLKDFNALGVEAAQAKGREKATLVNSRNDTGKCIMECISLMYDPKYISLSSDEKKQSLDRVLAAFREREERMAREKQNQIEKRDLSSDK